MSRIRALWAKLTGKGIPVSQSTTPIAHHEDGHLTRIHVLPGSTEDLQVYSRVYKEAAEHLWAHLQEKMYQGRFNDIEVMPIFFLVRHATELGLKAAILRCRSFAGTQYLPVSQDAKLFSTHDLLQLGEWLEQALSVSSKTSEIPELTAFYRGLRELNNWDPRSYSFRYPVNTKGNSSLGNGMREEAGKLVKRWLWLANRACDIAAFVAYLEWQGLL